MGKTQVRILDKWWSLCGEDPMTRKFTEEIGFQTLDDDLLKYRPFTIPAEYPALQYPSPDLDWDEWFN